MTLVLKNVQLIEVLGETQLYIDEIIGLFSFGSLANNAAALSAKPRLTQLNTKALN